MTMNAQYEAVLFDLDGTLIDTAPELADAVNTTLRHFSLPAADEATVRGWIGHGTRALVEQALAAVKDHARDLPLDTVMLEFARNYRNISGSRSRLYPGVEETLETLKRRGVPMVLVSNKESVYAKRLLVSHRLDKLFDLQVFGDSFPEKKPSPLAVQRSLAHLRVVPPRAVLVGDSEIDVATARNADVPVWLVSYGYRRQQRATDLGADRVISTMVDLLPAMRSRSPVWHDRARAGAE